MDLMRPWALIPGHGLDNETMHFDSGAMGLILGTSGDMGFNSGAICFDSGSIGCDNRAMGFVDGA